MATSARSMRTGASLPDRRQGGAQHSTVPSVWKAQAYHKSFRDGEGETCRGCQADAESTLLPPQMEGHLPCQELSDTVTAAGGTDGVLREAWRGLRCPLGVGKGGEGESTGGRGWGSFTVSALYQNERPVSAEHACATWHACACDCTQEVSLKRMMVVTRTQAHGAWRGRPVLCLLCLCAPRH